MKKILSLAVFGCLLAFANPVNAQLIVHPNGNAELGEDCFDPENPGMAPMYLQWLDTVKNGAEYEIEAAGEVKLAGGFTVEKGAAFAIRPASF